MIGTAREIALEMFRCSDLDGEKYVFASWNRNDIRSMCVDWDLNNEDLDEVMRRLSSCLESGADIGQIHAIVETMLDERHAKRTVTVPAASLEMVMKLAGSELKRIADCAEQGGGSAEDSLQEEKKVMLSLCAALEA
ncbi:hypothetical protein [Enterobacter kobei]|uniref:hypothetical protein n=1 Tax=Enterobacter kobei TaxID=208224 RepID=UPI003BD5330F